MDFNVIDYLAYHADVAVPAIILMVIVSAIYLIFYGIRPIKTRFLILFLLSIVSLIIFVLDNPLYYYLGSPFSGLLFVFYYLMVFSVFYVPFSLIAFIKRALEFLPNSSMYLIFILLAASGIAQTIIGRKENEKNKDYMVESGKDNVR